MSLFRTIVQYLYAPIFFIGFIGLAICVVDLELNKVWLIALLLIAVMASFVTEWLIPYETTWNQPKNDRKRDILHALVNEVSNALSIAAIPIVTLLFHGFDIWPNGWPLVVQLAMSILIADFGITMTHYISHKVESLWRFHAVHHSVERMYGFNGLMKHPLHQSVELIAGTIPLLLMGLPLEVGVLLGFATMMQLLLQHSNVDMRVGPLIFIWAVAPGHRHHHLASRTEGNVNFGLFTMIWDHLLGTFMLNNKQPRDGDLGIDGRSDFPIDYMQQLIEPFRKSDG